MRIVITDYTEFNNPSFYCVAGLDEEGRCLRPTDSYFSKDECAALDILAGTVLEGDFHVLPRCGAPHTEDCRRRNVRFAGYSDPEDFRALLEDDCADSVGEGFGVELPEYNKCIPEDTPPGLSIITVRADPGHCWFNVSEFNGKLRFSFTDPTGERFRYMPIADLKLREYASDYDGDAADHLNRFIHGQEAVFLRIGLGRSYTVGDREGFWLQMNGIYTFPGWLPGTRGFTEE